MADEIIRLDYSAEDIGDNIDEVRTARGEYDSLDERLDEIEGGGFTPTQAQLDAINSGITDDDVEQIDLNKNNILLTADQSTQYNYMDFNSCGTGNSGTIDSINTTTNTITVSGKAAWAKGIIYLNNVPSGTYRLKYTVSSNSSASAAITMNEGSTQKTAKVWNNSTGDYTSGEITFGNDVKSLYVTANNSTSALTNSVTITITNVMLIPASVYNAGFTNYQPYALPNATITPALKECVDNGKKQLLQFYSDTNGALVATAQSNGYSVYITGGDDNIGKTVTYADCTIDKTGAYTFSCDLTGTGTSCYIYDETTGTQIREYYATSSETLTLTGGHTYQVRTYRKGSGTNAIVAAMICESALYAILSDMRPYAMSNTDLTPHTTNVIKNNFTATDWTKVDELAFEIPAGKIAEFSASATRDNNKLVVGIAFVNSDTFSIDRVLAISENANENYYALAVCGIRSRKNAASETVNVFVKYSTAPVSSSITCTYRFV